MTVVYDKLITCPYCYTKLLWAGYGRCIMTCPECGKEIMVWPEVRRIENGKIMPPLKKSSSSK